MIDYILVIGSAVLGLGTAIAILATRIRAAPPPAADGGQQPAGSRRLGGFAAVLRAVLRAVEAFAGRRPA